MLQDFATLARELDALGRRAKGEDSLLALDVLRFVEKWGPVVESMAVPPAPSTAPAGPRRPLDLRGAPLDGGVGKIDSGAGG